MEAWVKVYHDLSDHPKTYALADALKVEQFAAVGIVVCLWTWAVIHAPDGDLERFPDAAIARACHWHKSAAGLTKALQESGFLDGRRIHDWDEYASALMDAVEVHKEKTRKRVEAYRERKRASEALQEDESNVTSNADVTLPVTPGNVTGNADVTPCNALRTRTRTRTICNTHNTLPQEGNACAREGWYSPEFPDMETDEAWRFNAAARKAVAQRIITYVAGTDGIDDSYVVTESGVVGHELHAAMVAAMEAGVTPADCQRYGERCGKAWIWEGWLKAKAIDGGAAVPDAWNEQVSEIREDLKEMKEAVQ